MVMAIGAQILIEPMFMWRDKLAPVTQRFIDPLRIKGFEDSDGASATREVVAMLRTELREMFWRSGAAFLRQGAFYPVHDTRSGVPDLLALLDKAVAAPGRRPDNGSGS